jgi:hypothetical protein
MLKPTAAERAEDLAAQAEGVTLVNIHHRLNLYQLAYHAGYLEGVRAERGGLHADKPILSRECPVLFRSAPDVPGETL